MHKTIAVALLSGALLTGCESTGPKEGLGTVIGAAGGGLLGAQFGSGTGQLAATALGVLGGALLGGSMGRSLDEVDRMKHAQAAQAAFETMPSGVASTWQNPDSGNSGYVTPQPAYQRADGAYCREFTQHVQVGGEVQKAYGTACRQPDGSWKIVG